MSPVCTPFFYCVHELGYSDDAAWKRIQAAKAARQCPAIFTLLKEGRLHLTGIGILAPHLRPENAEALLAAAAGKTKSEIELLIAQRFPRSEVLPLVTALGSASEGLQHDHVDPVARGGRATVSTVRLRCSTHNRLEAERIFGAEFMKAKQEQAQRGRAEPAPSPRT